MIQLSVRSVPYLLKSERVKLWNVAGLMSVYRPWKLGCSNLYIIMLFSFQNFHSPSTFAWHFCRLKVGKAIYLMLNKDKICHLLHKMRRIY